MHLSQYVLSIAILSTGVNAFYPYVRPVAATTSVLEKLTSRFYPYRLGSSVEDEVSGFPTFPLKKRSTMARRQNKYSVVQGNPPTTPNSVAVDDDGQDFSYFFSMDFGSKNQSMWMLFDTGGTNTWTFGSNCTVQACELHNTFGSNGSTTLQVSTQPFDVGYGTGTVSGVLGTDTVSFADFSLQLTFGLASNASSDFTNYPMDGILGLGRSNASTTGTLTAMQAIAQAHLLHSNILGISLQRTSDGAKDGEITFGGVDTTKFTGDISYTNISAGASGWQVPIDDAIVNGRPLNFTSRSAIIDTGTSYIFLPPNDASAVHALIPGSSPAGQNFNIPCSTNATVQFTFSGVSYNVSPKDYVGSATDSSGATCYSNIIGVQTTGSDVWLLGDVFLKNVYTVFDFDQNRIGFATRNGTVATTNPSVTSASAGSGATNTASSTTLNTASATPSTAVPTSGAVSLLTHSLWDSITVLVSVACLYTFFII
ncbi:putative aspartic-type endopeptidase [Talaromyces proteolyticus]|uniref:Aspartic-type endopeptidase n=1 Tax=Talaromyces proteolyticus TaxID=1131652 RepID=A0AAD4PVW9_9EURO|nr:putative aspartic-type endopeptidase [Talaromyces proteolyticus]KAH8697215.1 putative aspartic-type endopeptidase [Talaromyces proteolyticus]